MGVTPTVETRPVDEEEWTTSGQVDRCTVDYSRDLPRKTKDDHPRIESVEKVKARKTERNLRSHKKKKRKTK